jgi:hypothetical protein
VEPKKKSGEGPMTPKDMQGLLIVDPLYVDYKLQHGAKPLKEFFATLRPITSMVMSATHTTRCNLCGVVFSVCCTTAPGVGTAEERIARYQAGLEMATEMHLFDHHYRVMFPINTT